MPRRLGHTIVMVVFLQAAWLPAADPERPVLADGRVRLTDDSEVRFASRDEGGAVLGVRDEFVLAQSSMDRALRLKSAQPVTVEAYLEFVTSQVLEWEDHERGRVADAMTSIGEKLQPFGLPWPREILLIKTSGKEEGHAAYTRANAIVLPQRMLAGSANALEKLLCHELFHVLSRANPELQAGLYGALGFEKCNPIELPETSQCVRLTNPDAPRYDRCILVTVDGEKVWAVPILFTRSRAYDEKRGGEFFDYLEFQLLLLDRRSGQSVAQPLLEDGKLRFVDAKSTPGFLEQIGRNTWYCIHPEEIAAENFVIIVLGNPQAVPPSPEVIQRLREILSNHRQGT